MAISNGPMLVLQMQRMGDLVLTFPLLLWLKRCFPARQIHVVAEERFFTPLLPVSPPAAYISWPEATSGALHGRVYSLIINLSIREDAARLAGELSADEKLGPVRGPDGALRVHGAWQLFRTSLVQNNRHNRFHWADLNALDIVPLAMLRQTRYGPPREPQGQDAKSVGVFVGASDPAKRPDAAFYAGLVRELLDRGLLPVLLGGPDDVPVAEAIRALFDHPALNLVGKLSLAELVSAGSTLGLMITPDTGPMHVAAWTGLKTLNLSVGNVNPWDTGPYQPGHLVLRSSASCAQGCWACNRVGGLCRKSLSPRRVAALAATILRGPAGRLERLRMPGLNLYATGRTGEGLYGLRRLGLPAACGAAGVPELPELSELAGVFWRAFFLWRLAGAQAAPVRAAWEALCAAHPRLSDSLR
ncbi:MAG: glycosyltransferase family 9 protein, partial [Humidesulfovibrio sp.]|nr:glycosyltransferase family 9 protein [Humidesulfovibrio sp.]